MERSEGGSGIVRTNLSASGRSNENQTALGLLLAVEAALDLGHQVFGRDFREEFGGFFGVHGDVERV